MEFGEIMVEFNKGHGLVMYLLTVDNRFPITYKIRQGNWILSKWQEIKRQFKAKRWKIDVVTYSIMDIQFNAFVRL